LAYAKVKRLVSAQFFNLMDVCMKKVDKDNEESKKNYMRFVQFLEEIVAYHKYLHGGN